MKNIFRKNQVIITALVIMIAIAGYLNFTNDKAANQDGDNYTYNEANSNSTTSDDASVDTDSLISSADVASDELLADNTDQDLTADSDTALNNDEATVDDATDDADATTDISDEDIAASDESIPVSDSGELVTDKTEDKTDSKDSTGDAVLVNSSLNSGYFSSAKLKREQSRAQQKENLMDIINDDNCSEDQKNKAMDSILKINEVAEAESASESSIEARGFENVVVRIVNDSCEVIIGAKTLTDQQVAQVEDIVKKNTEISVENITITPVSVDED